MYAGLLGRATAAVAPPAPDGGGAKVNAVCGAVRHELERRPSGATTYRRTILTTYVCQQPPDLEATLLLVKPLPRKRDARVLRPPVPLAQKAHASAP